MQEALQVKLGGGFLVSNSEVVRTFAGGDIWRAQVSRNGLVKFINICINYNAISNHIDAWATNAAEEIRGQI